MARQEPSGVMPMRFPGLHAASLLLALSLSVVLPKPLGAQGDADTKAQTDRIHSDSELLSIRSHMADPATSSAATLEQQGDILRARRMPEDAVTYYLYSLQHNGNKSRLLNKIGLIEMQLGSASLARLYFGRAIKSDRKDASAWNNMGAVDYMDRNYNSAVRNYKRAVKLKDQSAVFHSNLGMAYFSQKDFSDGQKQITIALKLDPQLFMERSTGGISARFLSSEDRGQFCFEMAKAYAQMGNIPEMLHQLGIASEAGVDVLQQMADDRVLSRYRKDERVIELVRVANSLRGKSTPPSPPDASVAALPPEKP
jgi:tetratricopeptide (TPR) repeat protein